MFNKGDRVKIYGNTARIHSDYQPTESDLAMLGGYLYIAFRYGCKGTLKSVTGPCAVVELDKGGEVDCHVKQLTKLVKKKNARGSKR